MSKRTRRTEKQIFLDKLKDLTPNADAPHVSNLRLKTSLSWDDRKYERIRYQLLEENQIKKGTGKGGSVCLASNTEDKPFAAFVSYSHIDMELKKMLLAHLKPLERLNLIKCWHDGEIKAGDKWDTKIAEKLEGSKLILLLVSVDFLNSEFCYEKEFERAIELNEEGGATIVPIILRDCLWKHTPIGKFQALPDGALAVKSASSLDTALKNVAEGIRVLAEDLRKR